MYERARVLDAELQRVLHEEVDRDLAADSWHAQRQDLEFQASRDRKKVEYLETTKNALIEQLDAAKSAIYNHKHQITELMEVNTRLRELVDEQRKGVDMALFKTSLDMSTHASNLRSSHSFGLSSLNSTLGNADGGPPNRLDLKIMQKRLDDAMRTSANAVDAYREGNSGSGGAGRNVGTKAEMNHVYSLRRRDQLMTRGVSPANLVKRY
eukprot:GFYU01006192.1.p1 GENE.GFYU01006192.1~~GFYU01006192.1.p1  ORF type:complete len:210 (-),score=50.85 GFYU01006192.1:176-805(-)